LAGCLTGADYAARGGPPSLNQLAAVPSNLLSSVPRKR
jgi:hypothetical protein